MSQSDCGLEPALLVTAARVWHNRRMEILLDPQNWIALATLTVLELVLGVDNVVFISILASKLPEAQQTRARTVGLAVAMLMRIVLLFSISWVIGLTEPLFAVLGHEVSGRDLILIVGGLFLLANSTREIHDKLEGGHEQQAKVAKATFGAVIVQIGLLDLVFSLDSVITAVGMVDELPVMIAAVVISIIFMMVFAGSVSRFVESHPTVKVLALSFLLLIGMALVADGLHHHIPKGYIYFAMGFSVFVEAINLKVRNRADPVRLHVPYIQDRL